MKTNEIFHNDILSILLHKNLLINKINEFY